jgi:hypothetical protein
MNRKGIISIAARETSAVPSPDEHLAFKDV